MKKQNWNEACMVLGGVVLAIVLMTRSYGDAQARISGPANIDTLNDTIYLPTIIKPPSQYEEHVYYISPNGNDSLSGRTEAEAWATFNRAWRDIYPGDTLILLDGTYYQSLNPNVRNGEPGAPITIRAKNDGMAIIDGEFQRVPVKLGDTWPGPIGDYFTIEGIIAQNSMDTVVQIIGGQHNILRRVSAYNANPDLNEHVFLIWADNNIIEDCIAAGSGRKMIVNYQGDNNVIRRCFVYWKNWDGRNFCGVNWPNGQNIQIYHGDYNLVENNIAYGPVPNASISVQANSTTAHAIGNKVLGSIAIYSGMNPDGTLKFWGPGQVDPIERPGPSDCPDSLWSREHDNQRAGFSLHGSGEVHDNLFQDVLAWSNAGLGFVETLTGNFTNNRIVNATLVNNGIDNPDGPWPGIFGGLDMEMLQDALNKFEPADSNYIEELFIDWPDYPTGQRNYIMVEGTGARLQNRYVDGVLTNTPLWPWPMEDRVQRELGISVTNTIQEILNNLP